MEAMLYYYYILLLLYVGRMSLMRLIVTRSVELMSLVGI